MKFLRVAGLHYSFAKATPYRVNPTLGILPYQEQLAEIFSYFFNYGDSLTKSLIPYGYLASEILCDLELLQKSWAKENGCTYPEEGWQTNILIQQIQKIRPDILYFHNINPLPIDILKRKNELFPFLKCLIMFRGYPEINRPLYEVLSTADLLLVGSPILERICKTNGLKPYLFHHYFDDRILSQVNNQKVHPFTFVGTSGFGYGWNHQPRYHYLSELLQRTSITCWLEEKQNETRAWKELAKRAGEVIFSKINQRNLEILNESQRAPSMIRKLAFNGLARKASKQSRMFHFPSVPLMQLFPQNCKEPVFGLEMCNILASSQITFNKHTFAALGTVDNIRLFEATGLGACLLTDAGSNLSSLFEVDREVVAYSSVSECLEKIAYLQDNRKVCERIAVQGQKRTLRDHSASRRAAQIHELIQDRVR